jgi:hypothetical protein
MPIAIKMTWVVFYMAHLEVTIPGPQNVHR